MDAYNIRNINKQQEDILIGGKAAYSLWNFHVKKNIHEHHHISLVLSGARSGVLGHLHIAGKAGYSAESRHHRPPAS